MNSQLSVVRICHMAAIVLMLAVATSAAGNTEPRSQPKDIASFFREIIGDWIGTVEQYTDGVKADTKYFHAVVKQTSPDTYHAVFEYYRLDKKTQAPIQIGVTSMTNKLTPEGVATNTIVGKGDIFINPETSKPEEHQLSEVLQMSPTGSLEGKGSGRISVSGIALGAGKHGKVSNYTSTWILDKDVLSISERLKVTFRVLFFKKHFDVVDEFRATRGSDIVGMMKKAGEDNRATGPKPNQ